MTESMSVEQLVEAGAVFYLSHSGGKDSQAMYWYVSQRVPADQIVVVHADLGRVEWTGVKDHIRENISHHLNVVHAIWKDGSRKELLDMVLHRARTRPDVPAFPSSKNRYCTSDLKRGPIFKFIRRDMRARGATLGVNCTGLRAEESNNRAKKTPLCINPRLTIRARTVYEWLPIHEWTECQVFAAIAAAGQNPFHAYAKGNKRVSCVFCIFGDDSDLANGRRERPGLYQEYIAVEDVTDSTMFHTESLRERVCQP